MYANRPITVDSKRPVYAYRFDGKNDRKTVLRAIEFFRSQRQEWMKQARLHKKIFGMQYWVRVCVKAAKEDSRMLRSVKTELRKIDGAEK